MTPGTVSPNNLTQSRRIAVGIGCDRQASLEEIESLLKDCLAAAGLTMTEIDCLASAELKADEPGLLALAAKLDRPLRFFPVAVLEAQTPRLANPSEAVFRAIGCHGVAEAAALVAVGPAGRLLLPKQRSARVTCALAQFPGAQFPVMADPVDGSSGHD